MLKGFLESIYWISGIFIFPPFLSLLRNISSGDADPQEGNLKLSAITLLFLISF